MEDRNRKRRWFAVLMMTAIWTPLIAQTPGATSSDPRIKFKDGARYLRDLSTALQIPRESICKELGQYDCYTDAFRIVLGGVEPYGNAIVEPLETASLTTPIALDRVALRVCTERVAEDVKNPTEAVLFLPGPPSKKWKQTTAVRMYDKLLQRDARKDEINRLLDFYDAVAAEGRPAAETARDWTVLGCFSVASSLESVFY